MPIYAFDGVKPRIARGVYVHPDAVVIGDVVLGEDASVWPTAVLRGDYGSIVVGARTSVQDGTVLHTTRANPTRIGAECVVGHLVTEGRRVPPHSMVRGVPGHVMPLEGTEHARRISHGVEAYVENARQYPAVLRLVAFEDCRPS